MNILDFLTFMIEAFNYLVSNNKDLVVIKEIGNLLKFSNTLHKR